MRVTVTAPALDAPANRPGRSSPIWSPSWCLTERVPGAVRIACCQLVPDIDHPVASAAQARAALADAIRAGAQIVVLPELCTSGYAFSSAAEARAAAEPASGPLLRSWAQEAAHTGAVVIGGFCELADDGRVFNSAALVDASGVRAVYRKLHLWDREPRWFSHGEDPAPVVPTRFGKIGIGVCYDIEFPELTRGLALGGAQLIALPANWPREPPPPGRPMPALQLLAQATASISRVYVAACDRGGSERGLAFQGASVIAAPDGAILSAAEPAMADSETTAQRLLADCDLTTALDKRTGQAWL